MSFKVSRVERIVELGLSSYKTCKPNFATVHPKTLEPQWRAKKLQRLFFKIATCSRGS
jgi:hypothetical protein